MNAAERAKAAMRVAADAAQPFSVVGQQCLRDIARRATTPPTSALGWAGTAYSFELATMWLRAPNGNAEAAALCRAAASACVEAWQASRSRAEVREEALAALRNLYDAYSPLGFLLDMQAVGDWIRHIDKLPRVGAAIHDLSGSLMREPRQEIRSACSRAARALLLWREVMEVVAGE